ncbi:MAG: hypothetical protein IPH08_04125 [Rhodocyclaceae bacterium]|nr:hypothetical protein [Rhodocyclaceae bacterium]
MKRANRQTAMDFIRDRVDFTASSLSGRLGTYYGYGGRLGSALRNRWRADNPVYAVYSYDTPIAWLPSGGGPWVMPTTKYSPTTTNHQTVAARAVGEDVVWINNEGEEVEGRWVK